VKIKTLVRELLGHAVNKCRPIKENTVYFDSFHGHYSDNPKYISEKLHALAPDVKIVWSCSSLGKETAPDYAKKVEFRSKEYYEYVNTAKVVVDNHTGLREFGFRKRRSILLEKFADRKGQLCISTWHGTPLKKIGCDLLPTGQYCMPTSADYMVAGCRFTADAIASAFCMDHRDIRLYGTPRNDILFRQDVDTESLKEKLKLPLGKKIVLFAPTFRDNAEDGVRQLELLDVPRLLEKLDAVFGGEHVFVTRMHHYIFEKMGDSPLIKELKKHTVDGNVGDDMAEYLACTDILITDYSSSFFDFALTYKPCFLFVPDQEEYLRDRGVYLDFDALPFPMAETMDDLLSKIEGFKPEIYRAAVKDYLESIGNVESGQASQRIVEDILAFL